MQEKLESVATTPRWKRTKRAMRLAAGFALVASPLVGAGSACLDRPIGDPPPVTTNIFVDRITQTAIDKIDLLFMIDNSISMSDKQAILRLAVPDLVNRLVNPVCVGVDGTQYPPPPAGSDRCPAGQSREFNPINDINIAIVSSSLGDAGANEACAAATAPDSVDGAHLMGSNVEGTTVNRGRVALSEPEGYLQWRAGVDVNQLIQNFQNQVTQVGQVGCGWEASLESWFRFLIDPFPYQALERVLCNATDTRPECVRPRVDADGRIVTDANILAQRAAFLRPDSLVSIIMLTDENDCSIEPLPQNWVVAAIRSQTAMFRGSSACDTNPNDPCCHPCVLNPPDGCPAEPNCSAAPGDDALKRLPNAADGRNLRCFDQKRRFGYDFLYPTERYVNALRGRNGFCWSDRSLTTNADACVDGRGQRVALTPNPLYQGGRDESSVFLAGIVGVPWQAISTDVDANGVAVGADELRFRPAPEFSNEDWAAIAGTPGSAGTPPAPPTSPYMVETPIARTNIVAGNPINGRDYDTAQGQNAGVNDDLQYACIFPLPPGEERNCANAQQGANDCDCTPGENDKPLCQQQPGVSANTTTQYYAKAYPGLRELQVLRDYGDNSIIASICAKNVDDPDRTDFGYRPAIAAIVDRLKEKLGDRCLPRRLQPDEATNTIPCSLVEVQLGVSSCTCDESIARVTPSAEVVSAIRGRLQADDQQPCGSDTSCQNVCLCEVQQVTDPTQLAACQGQVDATGIEGWCYIANTEDQQIGNPELVANCPATERRLLRFVGAGLRPNTVTYVSCQGSSFDPAADEI